tara:strand:+ start:272 stop:538 length:267 start_codon:yes stop_codon:yes gene_type:complete
MVLRTPLILISGGFSQLPSGDVVPGLDATAQASGNAALVVAGSALVSGTVALASGNAALVLAATALASGNAALARPSAPAVTDTLLLL